MTFYMEDSNCKMTLNMESWGSCDDNKMAWFWVWVYDEWYLPENGGRELSCTIVCSEEPEEYEGECSVASRVKSFEVSDEFAVEYEEKLMSFPI